MKWFWTVAAIIATGCAIYWLVNPASDTGPFWRIWIGMTLVFHAVDWIEREWRR